MLGRSSPDQPRSGRSPAAGHEMGDGETHYAAIHVNDDGAEPTPINEGSTLVTRIGTDLDATESRDLYSEEAQDAEAAGDATTMSKERRLTLQQLDRFRRAMHKQNGGRHRSRRGWSGNNTGEQGDDEQFDNLFVDDGNGSSDGRELRFRVYPWPYWLFGAVIVIGTTVFVNRVHAHALGYTAEEKSRSTDWWKYVVAVVVYLVAIGFIVNGRVECFSMNKETGQLVIRSVKPLCVTTKLRRERLVVRELRAIADIRVEASGEFSGDIDTRCYRVHFDFCDGTHAAALETRSKRKTLQRCRIIKDFLFSSLGGPAGSVSDVSLAASPAGKAYELPSSSQTMIAPVAPLAQRRESASLIGSAITVPLASIPCASLPRKVSTATPPTAVENDTERTT